MACYFWYFASKFNHVMLLVEEVLVFCMVTMFICYRLVEEADFKSTTELFAKKGGEQKSLDTFIPKSESDFVEYAELIANKLRPYEVC